MREISVLFESLYSHFILRDVLAKVIPGLIDLTSLMALFAPRSIRHLLNDFPEPNFVTVVGVYGIGFMLGLLFQYLGSLTNLTHIHVWREKNRKMTMERSLTKAAEFQKVASKDQSLLRQRERYAVLKEMSANFAVSFVLILAVVLRYGVFTSRGTQPYAIAVCILLIVIIVFLVSQNQFHASEQRIWEEQVIAQFPGEILPSKNATG